MFNESDLEYRSLYRRYIGDVNFQRILELSQICEQECAALITNLSLDFRNIHERAMKMTYNEMVNYYNGVYKRNTNKETRYTVDELFDVRYRLYEFMIGLIITATENRALKFKK